MLRNQVHILLVEDAPADARLIQEKLSLEVGERFRLTHVTRLAEALEELQTGSFNLVLLDLSLPDAEGLDTISAVISHPSRTPIVVLTGLEDEVRGVKAVQMGVQDYLIKDQINGALLVRAVRYAIERHLLQEALLQEGAERGNENLLIDQFAASLKRTTIASQLFGAAALKDSLPEVFSKLSERYNLLLEYALEEQAFAVDHGISERLRDLAFELGFVKAGPRDIIDLHQVTLKGKVQQAAHQKAQAYMAESRILLIELMGHLISYYRNYALGVSVSSP